MEVGVRRDKTESINYDEYPDVNLIPERYDDFPLTREQIPDFAYFIMTSISVTPEGKQKFADKFLREYFLSENFQDLTDGWIFVFVNGDYFGCYPTVEKGLSKAYAAGYKGCEIGIYKMYMEKEY